MDTQTHTTLLDASYEHEETRRLVALVSDAAELVRTRGEAVFNELSIEGGRWRQGESYIFVLDPDGNMLVHTDPGLKGRNVLHLKDVHGKPIIRGLLDAATAVATITLDRPERLNALTFEVYRELREVFLKTFQACIQEGGAISVMPSYNEVDGVPSHANRWLLRDVLRGEWGFEGYTVSDYYAIWELSYRPETHGHFVAADKKEACALAVRAGVNIELPEPDCYRHLVELVRAGVLEEVQLDELVAPMLLWKFRLGLFDQPYVDPDVAERIVGSEANGRLALQAARETITLLRNDGGLLPLDAAQLGTIAVIGPNADRVIQGGYSGTPPYFVTVLEGIKRRLADRVKVLHSEGCRITLGGSWHQDAVTPSDPEEDRRQIREAVEVARQLSPKRTLFTHMAHRLEHEETNRTLPAGMALAYDGLRISLHSGGDAWTG